MRCANKPTDGACRVLAAVERAAQRVLDVRAEFLAPVGDDVRSLGQGASTQPACLLTSAPTKTATLADIYDPLSMPPALQQAHTELDRAVDKCYRPEPFTSERQRVEFLFALYEKLTAPLAAAMSGRPKSKPNKQSPSALKPNQTNPIP